VVSRHAGQVFFCVFEDGSEVARIALPHRLGDIHFGFIAGIGEGTQYGIRVDGPWQPESGHRFDISKLLLDPYALQIDNPFRHHADLTACGRETAEVVPKAIVTRIVADARPLPPHVPQFIYEIPVKAFTKLHPDVPAAKRGTIGALAEPAVIEHLLSLGIDTIELMPIAAWLDERHLAHIGLSNAWGYNPVSFMAPDPRLAPGGLAEVRATVDALHAVGIRVILDAVFNHSGEGDAGGATVSFRGLDNALYYRRNGNELANESGCGNTLACYRMPVARLVMDAMRSWVARTGIDGFRFDLAPVMGRGDSGFDANAPLLAAIEQDPLLSQLIMIAEPWDVGPGGYQLGKFPARWMEWNDRYRDDVRRFWRGDAGASGAFATRISGSSDIFAPHRRPSSSINYVAAHDGFTLRDAVTYKTRNNFANGEGNRDGNAHEPVWPGGDAKAMLATLLLSRGTPMLTAGDEFGRTQRGNNNAYAQDNETTWLDWNAADRNLIGLVAILMRLRKEHPLLGQDKFLTGVAAPGMRHPDADWIGADGRAMDWQDANALVIGLVLADIGPRLALLFNRGGETIAPGLPPRDGYRWQRVFCSTHGPDLPPHSVAVYAEETVRQAGVSDASLRQIAGAAGIENEWWEVDGTHHAVSPDTLRHILGAMRFPIATAEDAETARRMLLNRHVPIVADARQPVTLGLPSERRRTLQLSDEAGAVREIAVAPGETPRLALEAGYYDVWNEGRIESKQPLIVSPGFCFLPEDIATGARVWGLASHLYALRHKGGEGIGDFETLKRFADAAKSAGGRYAGLNPLHHLFPSDRSRVSPYQPSDRRFIDPIYIDIGQMLEDLPLPKAKALADDSRAAFARLERLPLVDYAAVWAAKNAILDTAFQEFRGNADFDSFVVAGGSNLEHHGKFEAAVAGERLTPQRISYRAYLQWIAHGQLKRAAKNRNLYCDLALGCAFDGGEIAQSPEDFAPGVSIGAPPDPFSANGQVWNLPPLSPVTLETSGLLPMRKILQANMRHAAALRIDHVLGFARQFWVPRGAEGREGTYVKFPLDALIAVTAIESWRARCLVVGEDLGTVPEGLREALAAANIFSYRVLLFEREGQGFKPPNAYPARALACLASHDLPTFIGWRTAHDIVIDIELGRVTPEEAAKRRHEREDEAELLAAMAGGGKAPVVHAAVAKTPSQIMLIQADDLGGEIEPLNVPGTDTERPNWRRRLTADVEDLTRAPPGAEIIAAVKAERPS
jgi:glycogen operon protein